MQVPWEGLAHVQNFFQLNFLFSGIEVSSTAVFASRMAVLLLFGGGVVWGGFKIVIKVLDCLQTFLAGVGTFPKTFFVLLLLVIPLSSDSLGARWIGYLLVVLSVLGLAALGVLILVLWKYGVDQTMRLIDTMKTGSHRKSSCGQTSTAFCGDVPVPETASRLAENRRDDSSWVATT
ncbi:MAG: hypothetical protein V1792_05140 [Pseudomonadota bacterium]